ncbi:MAG: hypothetical protein K8I82_26280, partial [Anaerolineae bacterium]|nr:hypothetical protein [Anaerolineae bacterium]
MIYKKVMMLPGSLIAVLQQVPFPFRLFVVGFVVQLYTLMILWNHTSSAPVFLHRYSTGYGFVVIFSVLWLLLWIISMVVYRRIIALVNRIPQRWYWGGIIITALLSFALLLPSFERNIKIYLIINWLIVVVLSAQIRLDHVVYSRTWRVGIVLICALMLIPLLITNLSDRRFRPDDGQWADYATSAFQAGGVYSRTWLQEPVAILPGLGWSVAAYGWVLEKVAFDMHVGRVWNFSFYLLAFVGIAALTWRIYGRNAALISTGFAVLSRAFIPSFDYRPDHQLPFASVIIFL